MQPAITSATVLAVSEEAIASDVDGEIVLININSGHYFGLDMVGSEIWRRLQAPTSVETLCTGLVADFDGEPATIEREAVEFVGRLAERGLVKSVA